MGYKVSDVLLASAPSCSDPTLLCNTMQIVEELLERNFGELELKPDSSYQKVWDADAASLSSAPAGGGESVTQVRLHFKFSVLLATA